MYEIDKILALCEIGTITELPVNDMALRMIADRPVRHDRTCEIGECLRLRLALRRSALILHIRRIRDGLRRQCPVRIKIPVQIDTTDIILPLMEKIRLPLS